MSLVSTLVLLLGSTTTANAAAVTTTSGDISVRLPLSGSASHGIKIEAPVSDRVADVDVFVRIDGIRADDLVLSLRSPNGTTATVFALPRFSSVFREDFGTGADDCSGSPVTFDADAARGAFGLPDPLSGVIRAPGTTDTKSLDAFTGGPLAGTWTLLVRNREIEFDGTLFCWGIVTRARPALPARAKVVGVGAAGRVAQLGPLRASTLKGTTYSRAARSLGSGKLRRVGVACTVSWPARNLVARFDAPAGTSCSRARLRSAIASGGNWATSRGVRLGSTEADVREVYPRAIRGSRLAMASVGHLRVPSHDTTLVLHRTPIRGGSRRLAPSVTALVKSGVVVGFATQHE